MTEVPSHPPVEPSWMLVSICCCADKQKSVCRHAADCSHQALCFCSVQLCSVLMVLSPDWSLSLVAVGTDRSDVWPMVRIYRGGFLLIEFLFLLGMDTQTLSHCSLCAKFGVELVINSYQRQEVKKTTLLSCRHQHLRLEASRRQPCAHIWTEPQKQPVPSASVWGQRSDWTKERSRVLIEMI